jgi:hypothetical protein
MSEGKSTENKVPLYARPSVLIDNLLYVSLLTDNLQAFPLCNLDDTIFQLRFLISSPSPLRPEIYETKFVAPRKHITSLFQEVTE